MKKATIIAMLCIVFSACTSQNSTQSVTTLNGAPFAIETALSGKPAVINFWASWCAFCKTELPAFQQFADTHPQVRVIGVNLQEDASVAKQYWQMGGYTFPAVLDPTSELKQKYEVFTQPTTIFLNAEGKVVERRDGPLTAKEIALFGEKISPTTTIIPGSSTESPEENIALSPTPDFLNQWYEMEHTETVKHIVPLSDIKVSDASKDGTPAINEPQFIAASKVQYLNPNDMGTLFVEGDIARFYPFSILEKHQIVNDSIGNTPFMVTYCRICRTSAVYSRRTSIGESTFGVSGFLYQTNLVLYDRNTETLWHQITGKALAGELAGEELELLPSNVADWKSVLELYPNAEVLSENT